MVLAVDDSALSASLVPNSKSLGRFVYGCGGVGAISQH